MAHVIETMSSLEWTQDYINSLMVGTEKVCDLLETKNEIVDRADAIELYRCHGQLAFENVSFSYEPAKADSQESPRKALDGVSFTIEQGQRVAIVGPTGAGKSTIFRLLFRFFDVQGGAVKVDGRDVRDYTQTSLRKSLGIVQQEVHITVRQKGNAETDCINRPVCSTIRSLPTSSTATSPLRMRRSLLLPKRRRSTTA